MMNTVVIPFPFITFSVKLVNVARPPSLDMFRFSMFAPKYSVNDFNVTALIFHRFLAAFLLNKARVTSTASYVSLYVLVMPDTSKHKSIARVVQSTVLADHLYDETTFSLVGLLFYLAFTALDPGLLIA